MCLFFEKSSAFSKFLFATDIWLIAIMFPMAEELSPFLFPVCCKHSANVDSASCYFAALIVVEAIELISGTGDAYLQWPLSGDTFRTI